MLSITLLGLLFLTSSHVLRLSVALLLVYLKAVIATSRGLPETSLCKHFAVFDLKIYKDNQKITRAEDNNRNIGIMEKRYSGNTSKKSS